MSAGDGSAARVDTSLLERVLDETNDERRRRLYRDQRAGIDLVRALKAEVDRTKEADSAKALLAGRRAFELGELTREPQARAVGAWALALGLTVQGHFEAAMPHFETARTLYLQLGRPDEAARVALREVQALAMTGAYEGALQLAERTRDRLASLGLIHEAAVAETNRGIIHHRLGQFDAADAAVRRALVGFAEVGDRLGMARAHVTLGRIGEQRDRFREALEHFRTALDGFGELGQTRAVAGTHLNLALLYRREGRLGRALDHLTQAQDLYQRLDEGADAALAQLEEARVKLELNLLGEAQALAAELVASFGERKMELERVEALTLLGQAQSKAGHGGEALATLETARRGWHGIGNAVQAALTDLAIARLRHLRDPAESGVALALVREARSVLHDRGLGASVARSWLIEAELGIDRGRIAEAEACLDAVARIPEAADIPDLAHRSAQLQGAIAARRGELARAEERYRAAIDRLETVRATLPVDEFRAAYMGDKLTVYRDLIGLLLDQGRTADAFEVVERARSLARLDLILRGVEGRPPAHDARAGRLQRHLAEAREALNWHLLKAEREAEPDWEAVRAGEREVSRWIQELERVRPEAVTLERVRVPPFARVQRYLDATTGLVAYLREGDEVSAFVVGRDGARAVRRLGAVAEVQDDLAWLAFYFERVAVGAVHTAVYGEARLRDSVDRHLRRLHDRLVAPLELDPRWNRLVVIPDGPLGAVPFAALWDGESYLIDRYRVSLAPSATTLLGCAARRGRGSGVVAFGIPAEGAAGVDDEVREIVARFDLARGFLGPEASRGAFFAHAAGAEIVHVAAHGAFRPDNPLFSGVRFDDGWLTARDLYRVRLDASLVVLSACETGRYGLVYGDASLGLARGFLDIGTPALVASLWPVKDRQTAELMTRLYGWLGTGAGVGEALRESQLSLRNTHPNPYHWAGFTVFGDPDRRVRARFRDRSLPGG